MNLVLVGTAFPLRGGIAHYVALLYRELSRKHRVTVINFSRQYPSFLFPGRTQEDGGEESIPVPNERILDSINPWTWVRAYRAIRRAKADAVVFKYWMPFFGPSYATVAWLARRFGKARVIYIADNVVPHERRPLEGILSWLALRWVDGFIVQSRAVREDLLRARPDAVWREVPHPVYAIFGDAIDRADARRRLGLDTPRVLLFFGYVRGYKGLPVLLRTLPLLPHLAETTLVVAGEFYEGKEEAEALISSLGLQDRVRLVDRYIPNEEVRLFFSAADVAVLPYRSATQSGIIQIAYQFDRPVITTDVGGLREVVDEGRTGFAVPPEDPAALAEAIGRFYAARGTTDFEANVRAWKSQFSWARLVEAIEELAAG
jgi:glycosyltransferase involved in cell wall biosynthesis